MIKQTLKRLSSLIQTPEGSFKRHNAQYEEFDKLEKERVAGLNNISTGLLSGAQMKVGELLKKHPGIKVAVDVGSGSGWSAAALSPLVERVYGIEPSAAGIEISRKIYPETDYPNVTWINGYAEIILPSLKFNKPAIFLTGCVLSHLRDKEVSKICKALTEIAPPGSVLSFAEMWSDESWHQIMWHVRTKKWWQAALPGWELDFHGPVHESGKGNMGFWGVKK